MPRSAIIGNGSLTIALDESAQIRELNYPHVGLENHTAHDSPNRVGFFCDGNFSWTSEKNWRKNTEYKNGSLVTQTVCTNEKMAIEVTIEDSVHTSDDIFLRKVSIENKSEKEREIRAFFHHDIHLYGDKQKDTAQYEPDLNGVLHYRQNRYFLVGGMWEKGKKKMDQWSIGKSGIQGKEGTFRDAEDGELSQNPIEQGSVDSVVRFRENFTANEKKILFVWICAGKKYHDVCREQKKIYEISPAKICVHTQKFWEQWTEKNREKIKHLPKNIQNIYTSSLLMLRVHADWNGGIIAAIDSDIMETNRDNYNYVWPRDGAMCAMTLMNAGERNIPEKFFEFCARICTEKGYFLHKYNPDESLGSSWLPWWKDGKSQIPIQQDESALVLIALKKHFETFACVDTIQHFFPSLILPLGNFLVDFTNKKTGLPKESYDMWEQDFAIHTSTIACVIAALQAAAEMAEISGHTQTGSIFKEAKKKMEKGLEKHCYCDEKKYFLRIADERKNDEVDSALHFLWKMGTIETDDEKMKNTVEAMEKKLRVKNIPYAMARKENDSYHFDYNHFSHRNFPGNPWVLSTLWYAEFLIRNATEKNELETPLAILEEVANWANGAGMLPEQIHPTTKKTLFISPLTWSHSAYADTVFAYLEKEKNISVGNGRDHSE